MKTGIFHALAISAVLAAAPVGAQFRGPSNTGAGVTTVAQVADARIDTQVVLTGHVVNHLREDYFTFQDETGAITVEIERQVFRGREVTPETPVRITGEVERSLRGRYIDVDRLEIL